jgi:hypothetical protein
MVRSRTSSVLAIGIVLVLAAGAEAADFCFNLNLNGAPNILVGKAFRVPSKGSCRAFSGFFQGPSRDLLTGNACTDSAGSAVEFNLMGSAADIGAVGFFNFFLPLPSLTGGGGDEKIVIGGGIGLVKYPLTADKVACSPPVVPVL